MVSLNVFTIILFLLRSKIVHVNMLFGNNFRQKKVIENNLKSVCRDGEISKSSYYSEIKSENLKGISNPQNKSPTTSFAASTIRQKTINCHIGRGLQ